MNQGVHSDIHTNGKMCSFGDGRQAHISEAQNQCPVHTDFYHESKELNGLQSQVKTLAQTKEKGHLVSNCNNP